MGLVGEAGYGVFSLTTAEEGPSLGQKLKASPTAHPSATRRPASILFSANTHTELCSAVSTFLTSTKDLGVSFSEFRLLSADGRAPSRLVLGARLHQIATQANNCMANIEEMVAKTKMGTVDVALFAGPLRLRPLTSLALVGGFTDAQVELAQGRLALLAASFGHKLQVVPAWDQLSSYSNVFPLFNGSIPPNDLGRPYLTLTSDDSSPSALRLGDMAHLPAILAFLYDLPTTELLLNKTPIDYARYTGCFPWSTATLADIFAALAKRESLPSLRLQSCGDFGVVNEQNVTGTRHVTHRGKNRPATGPSSHVTDRRMLTSDPATRDVCVTVVSTKMQGSTIAAVLKMMQEQLGEAVVGRIRWLSHASHTIPSALTSAAHNHGDLDCVEITVSVPFSFTEDQLLALRKSARESSLALTVSNTHPVDIVVQFDVIARRLKRLAVFDMDSTLISQECIDEMAAIAGVEAEVKAITQRAMNGELDFEAALRARVALLKGLNAPSLFNTIREHLNYTPGAPFLTTVLKKLGVKMAVLSGGFTSIISSVKDRLSLDYAHANSLEVDGDEKLTGLLEASSPIIDSKAKAFHLKELSAKYNVLPALTIAVGDGANDLPMLKESGLGVAFNAKPKVQEQAQFHINHPDLTPILFYLGLSKEDALDLVTT